MPVSIQPFADGGKYTMLTNQKLDAGDGHGSLTVLFCSVLPIHSKLVFPHNVDLTNGARGGTKLACKNAAPDVSYLPASTNQSTNAFDGKPPFSYLQFNMEDVSDYQFVAILEKPGDHPHAWTIAEFSSSDTSSVTVSKGHHQLLVNGLQLTLPATRPMMTEIKIPEVHSTLFAYTLDVKRNPCKQSEESFAPMLRQYIAEPYESKYFVNTQGGNINVHGISPYMPPPLRGGGASEGLSLQLWSDPTCNSTVEVSLKVDVLGSAGKLVMRYRSVFAAFPLLVVLIVIRKQFKVYDVTGKHLKRLQISSVLTSSQACSCPSRKAWTSVFGHQYLSSSLRSHSLLCRCPRHLKGPGHEGGSTTPTASTKSPLIFTSTT